MKRFTLTLLTSAVAMLAGTTGVKAQGQQSEPARTITNIRGDLYRVQDDQQVTVFLVTPDGIILGDPLNAATAMWLKEELEARYPNRPVRYVVYSHHHFDRASGGWVFNSTAEIVGHENFDRERQKAAESLPADLAALDQDGNGVLEWGEAAGSRFESVFASYDRNGDDRVTPVELYSHVASIESKYRTRRTIRLGGKQVDLIHAGNSHAGDMTALYFPAERVVFTVDVVPLGSLPSSIGRTPKRVIASATAVEALDFDLLVTGRGEVGTKKDVTVFRQYLDDLVAGVTKGFKASQSLEEIKRTLTLDQYAALSNYQRQRDANIAELYETLVPVTTNGYVAAQLNFLRQGSCSYYCYSIGGRSLGGTSGFSVSIGRFSVGGEISSTRPTTSRDVDLPYIQVSQHRDTIISFLAGYNLMQPGAKAFVVEAGPSIVIAQDGGTMLTLFSDSVSFDAYTSKGLGLTFGGRFEMSLGSRLRVTAPARLTKARRGINAGEVNFTVGGGLVFTLSRSGS